jgi:hypothetical protein
MSSEKLDLGVLKAKAQKATEGPWIVYGGLSPDEAGVPGGVPEEIRAVLHSDEFPDYDDYYHIAEVDHAHSGDADAEYIAAMSPDVTLALIERLEAAQEIIADFVNKCDRGEARSRRSRAGCRAWLEGRYGDVRAALGLPPE